MLFGRNLRKIIVVGIDLFLICFSIWISIALEEQKILPQTLINFLWLFPCTSFFGFIIFFFSGQYKSLTRYIGSKDLYLICIRNFIVINLIVLFGFILNKPLPSFRNIVLLWIFLSITIAPIRFILRDLIYILRPKKSLKSEKVAIYGAGSAGSQLLDSLRYQNKYEVVTFIDDDPSLSYRTIKGIIIRPPKDIYKFKDKIKYILLAIPSLSNKRYQEILKNIYSLGIKLLRVPALDDLTSGISKIDSLKQISIDDLLSRKNIRPKENLLGKAISNKVIAVTGAAGSIGSELSKQILRLKPLRLVLIDQNEAGLYHLEREINSININGIEVVYLLGNVSNKQFVESSLSKYNTFKLFHVAAYKHVPLVEANPLQGILNNVFSTRVLCEAARKIGLNQLILVSSDKAVRPTNVMGASKRLSELIIQAHADELNKELDIENKCKTLFSMVRFGNVLNSSGSVVPLFNEQIASGGPITLTHEKIQRYFMTITEAAELVLQASSLAKGGDVFLLDMGEPVLIKDLAKQMIKLSGLTVRDNQNPDGEIEIVCTGLRPGEKLYEELLIDARSEKTIHPLIYRASENHIKSEKLFTKLDELYIALNKQNINEVFSILYELVPEWKRSKN